MFERSIASIKREFNRYPHVAIRYAFDRLSEADKLKPVDQMELAGIFARGSAQGMISAVDAAGCVLENIRGINRNGGTLDPNLYSTLLNIVRQGDIQNSWDSMNIVAKTILKSNLTDDEKSSLVDVIVGNKRTLYAVHGAGPVLKEAANFRISLDDTKRLADVLRRGLSSDEDGAKQSAFENGIQVIRYSGMRGDHGQVIQDLVKDCAAALRTGSVSTYSLNEDERNFVDRMVAFTADGPVPVWKPEPRRHGLIVSM